MNLNPKFQPVNVPIVGQESGPMLLQTSTYITPKLRQRLEKWSRKSGIVPGDIGLVIMRLGLIALSQFMDSPEDQIKDPDTFIPSVLPENEKESN